MRLLSPMNAALLLRGEQGATDPLTRDYYLQNADYYVDSVNGSDSNDGTTVNAAFQTFTPLSPLIAADTIVCLMADSVFATQLSFTADGVRIGTGGTGASAIIDCSDVVTTWLDSGDRADANTNVYSKQITTASTATGTFVNVFEDGTIMTYVTSIALCQSTVGSFFVSSHTSTTPTIYIHPTGSTDPDLNGSEYRVTTRQYAIDTQGVGDDGYLFDVVCRRNLAHNGSIFYGRRSVIDSCEFNDGNYHSALARDGSLFSNCSFTNLYSGTGNETMIVFNENTPLSLGITVRDCTFASTVYDASCTGIFSHQNVSGDFGVLTIEGCTFTNINICIAGEEFTSASITNCTAIDCGKLLRTTAAVTYTVTDCSYMDTQSRASALGIETNIVGSTLDLVRFECTLVVTASGAVFIAHNNTTVTLTDCRLVDSASGAATGNIFVQSALTGVTLTVNGTVLKSVNGQSIRDLSAALTYVGDNNTFCVSGDADDFLARWHNTNYGTLALWQAATSQDANSTVDCAA